jgi:hypothetical protein
MFGAFDLGYSLSNNGQLYDDHIYIPKTYNAHTISLSDGMHIGYADWKTETFVIPLFPIIDLPIVPFFKFGH